MMMRFRSDDKMSSIASTSQADWSQIIKGCCAGGTAAAISKTTLAPVDRVKLILQLQNGHSYLVQKQSLIHCLRKIYVEQVSFNYSQLSQRR